MRKFLTIVALAVPMMAAPIVSYSTTGTFNGGPSNVLTAGTGTLTYLGGGGSVDLGVINPSNATFGTFNTSGFTSLESLAGNTFTLTINQTGPVADSGTLNATLTGTIQVNASSAFVKFASPTITLAPGLTYEIFQTAKGVAIVPPSTDQGGTVLGGTTTLQGQIFTSTVPEPGTVGLMGLGLVAVGYAARRRRA